jgi:ABC-type Fe3+ transport system substrate-binding protein
MSNYAQDESQPQPRMTRRQMLRLMATSLGAGAVLAACGSQAPAAQPTAAPAAAQPTAAPAAAQPTAAPAAQPTAAPAAQPTAAAAAGGKLKVSILNKEMTMDEIKAEVQKEGSLVVGNWTYTATDELVKQFKQYVKETYGADIEFTYEGTQQPNTYLTKIYAAQKAGSPSPYDVLAVEENYWADMMANDAVESYLPSGLVPNQGLVIEKFQHVPTAVAFQATAFPAIVYNKKTAPFIKTLKDLADPRLKGKLTWPPPGDITNGGLFLGLASELGKDYKDPAQMKEVVDWFIANIGPNVLKYTPDSSEMSQLLNSGAADAIGFWNGQTRLEYFNGHTDISQVFPPSIYPINGYLWIPKGATHPVLAQIFINWRISPEVQFPNKWPIDKGPWSEISEGFLGPEYESHVPDWFKKDYFNYFPTLDQIKNQFKSVDWDAYNKSQKEWQDYFAQKIGQ